MFWRDRTRSWMVGRGWCQWIFHLRFARLLVRLIVGEVVTNFLCTFHKCAWKKSVVKFVSLKIKRNQVTMFFVYSKLFYPNYTTPGYSVKERAHYGILGILLYIAGVCDEEQSKMLRYAPTRSRERERGCPGESFPARVYEDNECIYKMNGAEREVGYRGHVWMSSGYTAVLRRAITTFLVDVEDYFILARPCHISRDWRHF